MLKKMLRGLGIALITPFNEKGNIDFPSLQRLIHHVAPHASFLVLLGTTGEASTLTLEEKKELILAVHTYNTSNLPIIVGVGGNNTSVVVEEVKSLPLENITAIMNVTPYYSKPSQAGLFAHYASLAHSTPKPILLYNVPSRTATNLDADTTIKLAKEVKSIQGIKEASSDMSQCLQLLKDCPKDFLILTGEDTLLLPLLLCGMDGIVSVAGNAFPAIIAEAASAAMQLDSKKARDAYFSFNEAINLMFAENSPAGVKTFLFEMGVIEHNTVRLPLTILSHKWHSQVKQFIKTHHT